jgi:hypothetical protein
MLEKTITVTLPEATFHRLKQAAQLAHRSVDEMLATTIDAILAVSPQLANEWAAMHLLSDEALWHTTEPVLTPMEQERLHELNHLAGERVLTEPEMSEQTALLEAYQRSIVLRSQAIAILKLRGHPTPQDIPAYPNESAFPRRLNLEYCPSDEPVKLRAVRLISNEL